MSTTPRAINFRTWLGYLAGLLVLGFLFAAVRRQTGVLRDIGPSLNPAAAAISVAAGLAASVLSAWSWMATLRTLGVPCSFGAASRVWYASMLARYAPGTIPGIGYRVYLTTGIGAAPGIAAAATALDWVLWLLSALLTALLTAPWWLTASGLAARLTGPWTAAAVAGSLLAGLALLHPRLIAFLVRKASARAGGGAQPLTYRRTLGLLPIYLVKWPFYGLAMSVFLPVVGHPPAAAGLAALAASTGAFSVGWIGGFLSPISPGGLGVREGIIVAVLHGAAPGRAVLDASLLARLTTTLAEVLCWCWSRLRREKRGAPSGEVASPPPCRCAEAVSVSGRPR